MTLPLDADDAAPDEALLVAYGNGDRMAAAILTRRFVPRLVSYAGRMLNDRAEAEDVAQETMLRLWRAAPDWEQGEAKVTSWLFRVATNLCIDRQRKRKRQAPLEAAGDPASGEPGAAEQMTDADRAAALRGALDTLPERQRQAVVLRHLEGLSNPEIAQIMDIGVEAVESLTARGKRALKAALAGRRDELGYEDG